MATAKKDRVITSVIDVKQRVLNITVAGVGALTLDLNRVHRDNADYAAFHGFKQRIVDKAALGCDETTGLSATPQDKYDVMAELVDFYNSGAADWSPAREGGGERQASAKNLLIRAMIEAYPGQPEDRIRAGVEKWTPAERTAMMTNNAKVKAVIDRLRAEQVSNIDTDGLLSSL